MATDAITEATITREFAAPRELVFAAWTKPEHLKRWWGPTGFGAPRAEVDLRPGGVFRVDMQAPDGTILPGPGQVIAAEPPARLVFRGGAFPDADGQPRFEAQHTVTLTELDGMTRMVLEIEIIKTAPEFAGAVAGMKQGWSQSFDKLAAFLSA